MVSLSSLLTQSARKIQPAAPVRSFVKRMAPLARQGQKCGHLEATLRLDYGGDEGAQALLVLAWPDAAAGHSIARMLERTAVSGAPGVESESTILRRQGIPGRRVAVRFAMQSPPAFDELWSLAGRIGITEGAEAEISSLGQQHAAAPKPTSAPAAAAPPPMTAEDLAKVDSIEHNQSFDASIHPAFGVNTEVTNSAGDTFRLSVKRRGGVQRRVWIRVGQAAAG